MAKKPTHLSPALIERLDEELSRAIAAVERGEVTKAGAALTFAVSLDDDAKPVVEFTHKGAYAKKGSFHPAVQPRLDLDDEDEGRYATGSSTSSSLLRGSS